MSLGSCEPEIEAVSEPLREGPVTPPPAKHLQRIDALCKEEYARVVHYMVQKTGSWDGARDAVHEAVLKVLTVPDPESVCNPRAYLYRSARNYVIDQGRLGAIHRRIHRILPFEFQSLTPSIEPSLMHEERVEALREAMEKLRPHLRQLVRWRMWDELPYDSIQKQLAALGTDVNERTLLRWYKTALTELDFHIRSAEGATARNTG